MDALITYEGEHRLGRRDARGVLAEVSECMATFGLSAEPTESLLMLDMRADNDAGLNAAYEELAQEYGAYPRKLQGTDTDGQEWRTFFWPLPHDALDAAFDRVAVLQGRGGLLETRVGVKLIWKFHFRDPDTRELLPGQDTIPRFDKFPGGRGDSSSVVLNLGRSSSLSLWFLLPFSEPDAAFHVYLNRLQAALPTRFSSRGWRRWTLRRAGEWRAKKFSVDLD